MTIKTKLTLGVGLLFLLIILLSLVGTKYISKLKYDTENILQDNYNTLEYTRNMLGALEDSTNKSMQIFEANLLDQLNNITEIGEQEITLTIQDNFNQLKTNRTDSLLQRTIREAIYEVMDLNMQAIQRKSEVAKATADTAVLWVMVTGTLCFLIAFGLLVKLPSTIADPIRNLTESTRQIAAKNYAERVNFEEHSEFGELAKSFNVMAEKLEEYNNSTLAKLMMEKKRIEAIINSMHDPVIGLDEQLNVIFANEEAVNISGLRADELIGQEAQALAIKNDLIRTLIQDITTDDLLNGKQRIPIKIFASNKECYFEKETLHISIAPNAQQSARLVGHVIFLRNVTSYKELDMAKTNFIATVSHEFKTPISSMKMSLQLLENERIGTLNDEQKQLLESIEDDADRLLKITSELLNMSQVESGNIQLTMLPADPRQILQYAIEATKTQASNKQIQIEVTHAQQVSPILADEEKTAWIVTNLLSNAIRYSYDGSTVHLAIREAGKQVEIAVTDTGQGIAPQYLDKIFDRYFRIPGSKKEGTGLGLAISKEFMEAQGGYISVKSEFGAGSTFALLFQKFDDYVGTTLN